MILLSSVSILVRFFIILKFLFCLNIPNIYIILVCLIKYESSSAFIALLAFNFFVILCF